MMEITKLVLLLSSGIALSFTYKHEANVQYLFVKDNVASHIVQTKINLVYKLIVFPSPVSQHCHG